MGLDLDLTVLFCLYFSPFFFLNFHFICFYIILYYQIWYYSLEQNHPFILSILPIPLIPHISLAFTYYSILPYHTVPCPPEPWEKPVLAIDILITTDGGKFTFFLRCFLSSVHRYGWYGPVFIQMKKWRNPSSYMLPICFNTVSCILKLKHQRKYLGHNQINKKDLQGIEVKIKVFKQKKRTGF